jgi:GAF domain-containing protein
MHVERAEAEAREFPSGDTGLYVRGMQLLLQTAEALLRAKTLADVQKTVCLFARDLTGCDGCTFILAEGDFSFFAEENAIAPLWKGQRFPRTSCVSGWVMEHNEPVVIPDVFEDTRILHDIYRPNFVKAMAMVPVNRGAPIAAIGNYWALAMTPKPLDLWVTAGACRFDSERHGPC